MKFRKKRRRLLSDDEINLQITSLADIFIIILVFLLKSFSTGLEDMEAVTVPDGLRLPVISEADPAKGGLKVEITHNQVRIAGDKAAHLKGFRFYPADLNADLARGGTSKSLSAIFERERIDHDDDGKNVWIIADQRAPYATIQTVLASAALHGFEDFKLVVTQDE